MADQELQGLHEEFELLKSVEHRKNGLIQVRTASSAHLL